MEKSKNNITGFVQFINMEKASRDYIYGYERGASRASLGISSNSLYGEDDVKINIFSNSPKLNPYVINGLLARKIRKNFNIVEEDEPGIYIVENFNYKNVTNMELRKSIEILRRPRFNSAVEYTQSVYLNGIKILENVLDNLYKANSAEIRVITFIKDSSLKKHKVIRYKNMTIGVDHKAILSTLPLSYLEEDSVIKVITAYHNIDEEEVELFMEGIGIKSTKIISKPHEEVEIGSVEIKISISQMYDTDTETITYKRDMLPKDIFNMDNINMLKHIVSNFGPLNNIGIYPDELVMRFIPEVDNKISDEYIKNSIVPKYVLDNIKYYFNKVIYLLSTDFNEERHDPILDERFEDLITLIKKLSNTDYSIKDVKTMDMMKKLLKK